MLPVHFSHGISELNRFLGRRAPKKKDFSEDLEEASYSPSENVLSLRLKLRDLQQDDQVLSRSFLSCDNLCVAMEQDNVGVEDEVFKKMGYRTYNKQMMRGRSLTLYSPEHSGFGFSA